MDIAPLSMAESQPKLQEHADRAVMMTAKGKENNKQLLYNNAINTDIGKHLDVIADKQMDKRDELHKQLQQEIKWVQEKHKLLNNLNIRMSISGYK